jgi:hypothetical protein
MVATKEGEGRKKKGGDLYFYVVDMRDWLTRQRVERKEEVKGDETGIGGGGEFPVWGEFSIQLLRLEMDTYVKCAEMKIYCLFYRF